MIYVDPICNHGWRLGPSSHLFVAPETDIEELHAFALGIGLKRAWFQHKAGKLPHYDVTAGRRRAAVAAGAVELSRDKAVQIWRRWKPWPTVYSQSMRSLGSSVVFVEGRREDIFRWVLLFFGLPESAEVSAELWAKMEALEDHILTLR